MKEVQNIIKAYDQADFSVRQAVLATVVRVQGSSYRNPGARMLIFDNGRWVGSVSGGCLEGDAIRKARKVMQTGESILVTYDTMDDDNNTLGVGLGCNGIIDVLLERVDHEDPKNQIALLKSMSEFKELGVLALVFHSESLEHAAPGDRLLLSPNGTIKAFGDFPIKDQLIEESQNRLASKQSGIKTFEIDAEKVEVLFEVVEPAIELLIFGAGFDAQPVVAMAKSLGWRVKVTDECVAHMIPMNFPQADQLVACKREYVQRYLEITPYTAVVLMSHNFHYDLEVLKQIQAAPMNYLGILGPRKRLDKLLKVLADEGLRLSENVLKSLHAPIGLDIGAETPDEIALSILSEVLARFSGRSGGFLKYHQGPIHKREGINDQVFKRLYLNEDDDAQQTG